MQLNPGTRPASAALAAPLFLLAAAWRGSAFLAVRRSPAGSALEDVAPLRLRGGGAAPATAPETAAPVVGTGTGLAAAAVAVLAVGTQIVGRRASVPRVARRAQGASPVLEETEAAAAPAEEPEPPFDPSKQAGVTLPLMYFDPLGFSKVGDKEGFRNLRAAELKHGRVAMMAAAGIVFQHWFKFPGFEFVPNGLQAAITPPATYGLVAILAAASGVEAFVWVQDPEKEPGDFGDPLKVGQYYMDWRNRELNNCRMAMLSIVAILFTEAVTGLDSVDQIWKPVSNLPVE
mmetsp:Transcript_36577/g.77847  ORF Transcript_36577/g.77847 Transcript_36577/m.77847 type:complete len:289 (-) Transcript_36577:82-948(-)